MKSIINGKRYDTATATLAHSWDNGHYTSDFKYRSKDLYRTPRGAWFIHHEGGAMTDMAERCDSNSYCGGSSIEPVSDDDARAFLESHGGTKALETHFADAIEDA